MRELGHILSRDDFFLSHHFLFLTIFFFVWCPPFFLKRCYVPVFKILTSNKIMSNYWTSVITCKAMQYKISCFWFLSLKMKDQVSSRNMICNDFVCYLKWGTLWRFNFVAVFFGYYLGRINWQWNQWTLDNLNCRKCLAMRVFHSYCRE